MVIGGMIVMFGFVSLQGMQMLARVDFANNEHNFLIAAVSIAVGVGFNNNGYSMTSQQEFSMFFKNGIVMASTLAQMSSTRFSTVEKEIRKNSRFYLHSKREGVLPTTSLS